MSTPKRGTDEWDKWVERLIEEKNEAKRDAKRLSADLEAAKQIHEAEMTNLDRVARSMYRVCRNIIEHPLTSRTDVQSKLILTVQSADKEMGETFWMG